MDDLGLYTTGTLKLHHEQTCHVLQHLREHSLSLKLSKCAFDTPSMEYLGLIIGNGLVKMNPVKLSTINTWKPPTSVKGVHSFLGFTNFYWKSILITPTFSIPSHSLPKRINLGFGELSNDTPLTTFVKSSPLPLFSPFQTPLTLFSSSLTLHSLWQVLFSCKRMLTVTYILVPTSPKHSPSPSATMIFTTENSLLSFSFFLSGNTIFKAPLFSFPSLPTTKIFHI